MHSPTSLRRALASFAGVAAIAGATAALALDVTVDGQLASFNPPPIERAGRVYVPLRGVFERLGATVVYSGGIINATGNGRQISLKIGSTTATVGGQPETLDSPPFIIGASTYVPLRFVSEALGAHVFYDAAHQVVALTTRGGPGPGGPPGGPPPMQHVLTQHQPPRDAIVGAMRPTISANFTSAVVPDSVRITLDGRDVTSDATVSQTGFVFAPPSPLQSMPHTVVVQGKIEHGPPFTDSWSFTTGNEAPVNRISIESPGDGTPVPSTFTIVGHTVPGAMVHVVAGATGSVGGVFAFGAGSFAGDTVADGAGRFAEPVQLQTVPGAAIGVTVTSTDPATKGAAEKKLRLRAQ